MRLPHRTRTGGGYAAVAAAALAVAACLTTATPAIAAPADVTGVPHKPAESDSTIEAGYWALNYYRNYFESLYLCNYRGNQILDEGGLWDTTPTWRDVYNYSCHLNPGESKYSMDLYFML